MGGNNGRRFYLIRRARWLLYRYRGLPARCDSFRPADRFYSSSAVHRSRNRCTAGEGGDRESSRQSTSLSLSYLRLPQALGEIEDDFEHENYQQIHPARPFQNGNASILPSLEASDWAVSRDLRDAYFHIPIHPVSRELLGFRFKEATYRYRAIPFGLRPAPRVFTRVVTAVAAHLRERGLRLSVYLDDWLLVVNSKAKRLSHLSLLLRVTQELGFVVNWEKSDLSPSRVPTYLGAVLDLPNQIARPSPDRVRAIVSLARSLRERSSVKACTWLRLLRFKASLVDILRVCRLLMRPVQRHLLRY
ncbi:uncharacterized protein LOC135157360 [Lytechinus pictus]|uniref:uncharacterized protein LOC135157360 n=1 Tax=Lytechinus pictus TaxID=7653 RepID=UPI0030B9E060